MILAQTDGRRKKRNVTYILITHHSSLITHQFACSAVVPKIDPVKRIFCFMLDGRDTGRQDSRTQKQQHPPPRHFRTGLISSEWPTECHHSNELVKVHARQSKEMQHCACCATGCCPFPQHTSGCMEVRQVPAPGAPHHTFGTSVRNSVLANAMLYLILNVFLC